MKQFSDTGQLHGSKSIQVPELVHTAIVLAEDSCACHLSSRLSWFCKEELMAIIRDGDEAWHLILLRGFFFHFPFDPLTPRKDYLSAS